MIRRYSLEPFLGLTGWTMNQVTKVAPCNGSEYQLRRTEGVTERTADRLAVTVGLHPWTVWPEMADDVARDLERTCAADGCDATFTPPERAPHALYCSPRCRQREKARRYRSRPHGAAANRRHRRAYYEANRGYELAQKRRERERVTDHERAA